MKKTVFLGLLAMALAFGFIGCETDGDTNYTVTFNLAGGNINGNTSSVPILVSSGGTIDNLPNPQRAGYDFGGWFTGIDGSGNQFTSTTVVTANRTVFAKWTLIIGEDEFVVTFDLAGGNVNGSTSSVQIAVSNGGMVDNLPNPQRTNYSFGGWFTGTDGAGNQFTSTTVVTENRTVFAKWTSETGNDDPFAGTWEGEYMGMTVKFVATGGNFTQILQGEEAVKGTYTVSGNTVTIKVTHAKPYFIGGTSNQWVEYADLSSDEKTALGGSDTSQITVAADGNTITTAGGAMTLTKTTNGN